MAPQQLTGADLVFVQRMLPHFLAGKTPAEAAAAVIEDDCRLFAATCKRRSSYFVPTADERGRSVASRAAEGDVISSELSATVYRRLRSPAQPEGRS